MRAAVLAFAIPIVLVPVRARADAKADAKTHIDKATAAHAAGKLEVALNELNIAYTLDPQPDLLYAIAQVHVQLGHCPQAITFYKRFLATHPPDDAVAVVNEAIHTCETAPPPVDTPPPEPPPVDTPPPQPPAQPPPHTPQVDHAPFYTDVIGDGLVGGGIVAGVIGGLLYTSARGMLDDAEHAATYDDSKRLVDSAHSRRTISIGCEVGAGVLIAAGIVHYMLHDDGRTNGVAVVPASGGGLVLWGGRW